jgi:predicted nuclease of predicted toxin-antitoxin system
VAEPIRFYFDQHVWRSLARALRARGVELLTAQDAGQCGLPDPDQLAFAAAEERVMMTFDTDYLALHNSGTQHAGNGQRI